MCTGKADCGCFLSPRLFLVSGAVHVGICMYWIAVLTLYYLYLLHLIVVHLDLCQAQHALLSHFTHRLQQNPLCTPELEHKPHSAVKSSPRHPQPEHYIYTQRTTLLATTQLQSIHQLPTSHTYTQHMYLSFRPTIPRVASPALFHSANTIIARSRINAAHFPHALI
jgi:hypothetical protein